MKALILVDLQIDLMPGGAIAVPNGDAIIPVINQLQGCFKLVVATQDWHPANHRYFAANHPGKQPGETAVFRKTERVLNPVHCVQNTRGAELAPALMLNRLNKVFKKGTDPDLDSFSAFFDSDHQRTTGLASYLQEKANQGPLCLRSAHRIGGQVHRLGRFRIWLFRLPDRRRLPRNEPAT